MNKTCAKDSIYVVGTNMSLMMRMITGWKSIIIDLLRDASNVTKLDIGLGTANQNRMLMLLTKADPQMTKSVRKK